MVNDFWITLNHRDTGIHSGTEKQKQNVARGVDVIPFIDMTKFILHPFDLLLVLERA